MQNFLTSQGVEVGAELAAPPDPYTELLQHQQRQQRAAVTTNEPAGTAPHEDKLGRFLAFDRQVLRYVRVAFRSTLRNKIGGMEQ